MTTIIEGIAERIAAITYEDLPEEAVDDRHVAHFNRVFLRHFRTPLWPWARLGVSSRHANMPQASGTQANDSYGN